jgi:hypothetical protein
LDFAAAAGCDDRVTGTPATILPGNLCQEKLRELRIGVSPGSDCNASQVAPTNQATCRILMTDSLGYERPNAPMPNSLHHPDAGVGQRIGLIPGLN